MNTELNSETLKDIREWQERIEYLRSENNQMKDRLAKAALKDVTVSFLEASEYFYQIFLDKDQAMDLIRHEISSLLSDKLPEEASNFKDLSDMFRNDLQRFEKEFYCLKIDFLNHLTN
jgi:hypothetical protein